MSSRANLNACRYKAAALVTFVAVASLALGTSGVTPLELTGAYAVFAAYFLHAPVVAAFSFGAALAYANYESFEYGRTVLIAFGLWQKARMEEGFLTTELGAEAYGPYCRRVPMLVPFLPTR